MGRQPIVEILRAEVERTHAEYDRVKQDFRLVSADIPSGLPHPDGMQRIRNASRAQLAAIAAFEAALKRFNGFLVSGTVPQDLEKDLEKDPGSPPSKL
jgi:hypothetical protein